MNESNFTPETGSGLPQDDATLFDRLVDGELSEQERRALLASLDKRTDGWRQCALAFLEAQTWGHALDSFGKFGGAGTEWIASALKGDSPAPATSSEREVRPSAATSAKKASSDRVSYWLGTAASVLCVFSLGMFAQGVWRSAQNPSANIAQTSLPSMPSPMAQPVDFASPLRSDFAGLPPRLDQVGSRPSIYSDLDSHDLVGDLAGGDLASGNDLISRRNSSVMPTDLRRGPGPFAVMPGASLVSLAGTNPLAAVVDVGLKGQDGRTHASRVPVYDATGRDATLVAPTVMNAALRDALMKEGYAVDEQRSLVPVRMPDGRQVLLPVSQAIVRSAATDL